jgi:LPS-assembly protein
LALVCGVWAQQPNPVDRQVSNPLTDTPNVNPLLQNQPVPTRRPNRVAPPILPGDEVKIEADGDELTTDKDGKKVIVYKGNVDARVTVYHMQADKITYYEATNTLVAEGNVVFDQEPGQRITGSKAEFNAKTKTGYFLNATGYTDQSQDGTTIYFTADRVEKVSYNKFLIINGTLTACDEEKPKWKFKTKRATIVRGERATLVTPGFSIKGKTVLKLPYASVSLKPKDRQSGFLTPTFGRSNLVGFRLSNAYYQTLGRSADATLRLDTFSKRGVGFGFDVRTRANSRSALNLGFYAVKDRIFGPKESPATPNQGGSSFYVDGAHYFPNGFVAAADINVTSNLSFRQVFSDNVQQAISPEERSQLYVNKNWGDYSLNVLARTQVTSLSNARIRTRQLPSITLEKRFSPLVELFKKVPLYWGINGGVEGVSRKETPENLAQFRQETGGEPIISPSIVQRLYVRPEVSLPLSFNNGWSFTATFGLHTTYYSNTIDPTTRLSLSRDLVRGFADLELDLRPPALARDFRRGDNSFRFRHVIEPYLIYRKVKGITNFERILRVDYTDTYTDTNEVEYGVSNRFFTRRSTETVGGGKAGADGKPNISEQPYEALTVTIRGKYFFDPNFGGALVPGRRNQIAPIYTFSGFTYGGVPRRFSPLNITTKYRPFRPLSADVRMDLDTQRAGLRNLSATLGLQLALVRLYQTFYYTRSLDLPPSLAQFADARGKEPGTLRGSQWSPSLFLGQADKPGPWGGVSVFFDFQNRPGQKSSFISSTLTLGYTWDCCSVVFQNSTFNVGVRAETRTVFSFRLNGIGAFGTDNIGQRF